VRGGGSPLHERDSGHAPVRVLSVILLPTTACNCNCTYCFEVRDDSRPYDPSWPSVLRGLRPMCEMLGAETLRLFWQGGEILCLEPREFREAVEAATRAVDGLGIKVQHHVQTNLLLYDSRRWRDVLMPLVNGKLSSSLDFPNRYRVAPGMDGEAYLARWLDRRAAAEDDGFEISAISLASPETLALGAERFHAFYRDGIGLRRVQVNFPFPTPGRQFAPLDLDQLAAFMCDLYSLWVASGRDLHLSPFTLLESSLLRGYPPTFCIYSYTCAADLLAIGPAGEVAQCDSFLTTYREFAYGSLARGEARDVVHSPRRRQYLERPLRLMRESECADCEFLSVCFGGCPIRAYAFGHGFFARDHYCSVYKALFRTIVETNQSSERVERLMPCA